MVAADDDRGLDRTGAHEVVERQPGLVALTLAEPADPRRQALEGDALLRAADPLVQAVVVGEQVEHGLVGDGDVLGVTREGGPAERALALAEQRPDVGRHEAGELERPLVAALTGLVTDRVAVVEDLGAGVLELDHRLDLLGHRGPGAIGELLGLLLGELGPLLQRHTLGQVGQRVVGAGLVGDDVDRHAAAQQLGEDLGSVADDPDRPGPTLGLGAQHLLDGVVEVVGDLIEVAVVDAAVQAGGVDVDHEADALVHGDRERLGATHAAAAAGEGQGAGQGAVEPLLGHRGEGLVGALDDALGADVDPRPGGHLAVHREAKVLEAAELWPGRPVADEVGVGDEHARRPLVGLHDADRAARLHEHRLVGLERGQGADHRVEGPPVARGPAGAAVDDEVVGALGVLGVEVVHEHPQGGLGRPLAGREGGAAGAAHGAGAVHGGLLRVVVVGFCSPLSRRRPRARRG